MVPRHLVRKPLSGYADPYSVACHFSADHRPIALVGAWAGGGAIIASEPVYVSRRSDDPFELVAETIDVDNRSQAAIGGGWFGYFGYQMGARVERLPPPATRPTPLPDFSLGFYDHILRYDAHTQRWWFEGFESPHRSRVFQKRLSLFQQRIQQRPQQVSFETSMFKPYPAKAGHVAAVGACRDLIHAGDIFQANLCLRLSAIFAGEPYGMFSTGGRALRPPFAAALQDEWGACVSFSPELFLRRRGRTVITSPIKGTSSRAPNASVAARQRQELTSSEKNQAENVMIVDLMRNDLGRVCSAGSVRVPALIRAEEHPGVWHLVSDVVGELERDVTDGDLLRACFPPGSVTGAPKVRAMEVISELEATAREIYTGAIGYVSPTAGLELNVAIRTFEIAGSDVWLGAGGGIVADSDPAAEFDECLTKARPLIHAIHGTLWEDAAEAVRHDGLTPSHAPMS